MPASAEVSKSSVKRRPRTPAASKQGLRKNEFAPCLAANYPAVMPVAAAVSGPPPSFPRDAIPALRLHFQTSRAEYFERHQSPENPGFIELYCKLCTHLVVASRDEFVLPIAVKAHKCGGRTPTI
ncbi:MAG: hypothetical protein LAO78_17730 [Acidobacteriia bacterium]|nr:hypothetical protein [Terriglobia bacterium]